MEMLLLEEKAGKIKATIFDLEHGGG